MSCGTLYKHYVFPIPPSGNDQDYLLAPNDSSSLVTVNQTNNEVIITGLAPVNYYIELLSQVRYVNYADEPGESNRTITFECVDDRGFSISANTTVMIVPTNDPAVFTVTDSIVTFNEENGIPVTLFQSNDTLIDPDGDNLQWIIIEIRPSIDEMDVLSVDLGSSSLMYTSGSGFLNISGQANFSVYEEVLRTVSFNNPSPGLDLSNRTLQIVTFDGETESPPTLITITIEPFDDVAVCFFTTEVSKELYQISPSLNYSFSIDKVIRG